MSFFYQFALNPNLLWVLVGAVFIGATSGIVGTFSFLQKRALIGDTLAHAALPGVTTAFMLTHSRDPMLIILGAFIGALVGNFAVEFIVKNSKIKEDSALCMVLSFFFALGVFQLTLIQKMPLASQAGLDKLLFGQAASIMPDDIKKLIFLAALILLFVIIFYRSLKSIIFDRNYAVVSGMPVFALEKTLLFLTVLSVVVGLQLAGAVLIAALMITPPASARYWSDKLHRVLLISAFFGGLSGLFGVLISSTALRMPTGPWIVVFATGFFLISLLFAPQRGILFRWLRRIRLNYKINSENVLRTLYKNTERRESFGVDIATIMQFRKINQHKLERVILGLKKSNLIREDISGKLSLTDLGVKEAVRVTRRHRLWELYLTKELNLPADHAHLDAEEIEHLITEELEKQLAEELGEPLDDPHGRIIP